MAIDGRLNRDGMPYVEHGGNGGCERICSTSGSGEAVNKDALPASLAGVGPAPVSHRRFPSMSDGATRQGLTP